MSNRLLQFAIVVVVGIISGCAEQRRGPPLAQEIDQYVALRATSSCDDIEANYRVAKGVRAALDIKKYRGHVLRELPGWSAAPMKLSDARAFSARSARLLREELTRRCPQHRITGREDIVYIPS